MNNRLYQNRRGVTLLFVISMIVLFLLMGTTFVVVSNDFLRASRQASNITVKTIESVGERRGQRFMTEALHQLLRGPDLNNVNSPLRGHSILADMYGYGFTGFVKSIENLLMQPGGTGFGGAGGGGGTTRASQFLRLELIGFPDNVYAETVDFTLFEPDEDNLVFGNDILSGEPIQYSDMGNAPGRLNGQLLTFVTGAARGISCRIIDHQVFVETDSSGTGSISRHKFVVMMIDPPAEITNQSCYSNDNDVSNDTIIAFDEAVRPNFGGALEVSAIPTRVVVNGRAFAGTGVGLYEPSNGSSDNPTLLGRDAYNPNQKGKSREELYEYELPSGDIVGYLGRVLRGDGVNPDTFFPNSYATNEAYDAPDHNNMFLASRDSAGNISTASFWRPDLPMQSPGQESDYSFRPLFNVTDPEDPQNSSIISNSSCTSRFSNILQADGSVSNYTERGLDVDNDGNGENDGVWIDINLPIYTDKLGRRIKPLVSYTVVDLDSLANVNLHGNRSHIPDNDRFADRFIDDYLGEFEAPQMGGGMGPSEIRLSRIVGDVAAENLMMGVDELPGRYGAAPFNIDGINGGGPAPGEDYVDNNNLGADILSAYKLFGYPYYQLDPDNLSVLGGHYGSPMDIYGRFRMGYPVDLFVPEYGFQTSMPVIDVYESTLSYSEIVNNPYEVNLSPPPRHLSAYDQLYTLQELETVYREGDSDIRTKGSAKRLLDILRRSPGIGGAGDSFRKITTESWEVPTLVQEFMAEDLDDDGDIDADDRTGLENLMTKLYNVLNTPNPSGTGNYGIPDNDVADPVFKHDMIMRHLTGFFADTENDTFLLDVGVDGDLTNPPQRALLSNETRSGRPFDINRAFGNGNDDNNNGVVDEPGENEELAHPGNNRNDFDHDQDGFIADAGVTGNQIAFGRQLFARQLYILTLLVTEMVDRNGNGRVTDDADFPNFGGMNDADSRRAYRKMVAQWAINVADFRDRDSIYTMAEFDLNPFDGWGVDGDLSTNEISILMLDYFRTHGTERPELLLSENMHWHDRREEDLDEDDDMIPGAGNSTMDDDEHFDSRLVPVASGFFELYHPWVTSVAGNEDFPNQFLPAELGEDGVDLSLLTDNGAPVWRIVVANNFHFLDGGGGNVVGGQNAGPEPVFEELTNGYSFLDDPDQRNDNGTFNLRANNTRRYVYFTRPTNNGNEFNGNKAYAPPQNLNGGSAVVRPGGFAVLGSAGFNSGNDYTTYLGRNTGAMEDTPDTLLLDETQRIVLNPNDDTVSTYLATAPGEEVEQECDVVLPLVGVADPTRSYGATDPVNGYTVADTLPLHDQDGDGRYFVDGNGDPIAIDDPVDTMAFTGELFTPEAFINEVLRKDQLSNGCFVILLQRIANPLEDWDQNTNPYVTVDSSGGDVLAFNGVANQAPDDDDTIAEATNGRFLHLGSFERQSNLKNSFQTNVDPRIRNLWRTDYTGLDADAATPPANGDHFLDTDLVQSLGAMNPSFIAPFGVEPDPEVPGVPFNWLTWNNRPFNSAMELTMVPYTSSFFLTSRFDISIKRQSNEDDRLDFNNNLYRPLQIPEINDPTNIPPEVLNSRATVFSGEFPHLLNFHADENDEAFQLHRLFDYVEVPSRYIGTETYVNPRNFISSANNADQMESSFAMSFAPPSDFVSNYREPGKVNLNTMTNPQVWQGIMDQDPQNQATTMGRATYNTIRRMRGTNFENPFRPAAMVHMIPPSNQVGARRGEADAGFFRRQRNGQPMFDYQPDPQMDDLRTIDRNAYFRNLDRQRLANLVTNRSSVFAIWITVGYFEVTAEDAIDADGNDVKIDVFGQEVSDEDGITGRNRGFFIFDRSIPVAFEPGRDHNVEKAIRVSSYIE